jgi:hypothetical protein
LSVDTCRVQDNDGFQALVGNAFRKDQRREGGRNVCVARDFCSARQAPHDLYDLKTLKRFRLVNCDGRMAALFRCVEAEALPAVCLRNIFNFRTKFGCVKEECVKEECSQRGTFQYPSSSHVQLPSYWDRSRDPEITRYTPILLGSRILQQGTEGIAKSSVKRNRSFAFSAKLISRPLYIMKSY